ncbi:uncharacterized protein LOC132706524 isoform X2 [Cylas formicarius]|uniref:uncharacterized protein LOC132706524 isoform X2 n=1 Tax=Cylas formicarius TaxID=197179 RepID=UPI002958A11B|nr:uncharacterized protein LOC132706524 isoform X2 [Cylas formicarius]
MEPNSNRIEKYLEETMLEYLRSQIEIPEFDVDSRDSIDDGDFVIEFEVNRVLDKLVENVQRTASLKVKYEETGKTHHQAVLFKLPGFPLDVNLMRKLCFRECLIVSNVDEALGSKECTPDPAGALCLHIQLARDSIPPNIPPQNEDVEYNIAPSIKNEVNPQREADDHASYKLVVHLSSEFEIEGKNAGSRIVSWVDRNLHTLEERRTEYIRESPNVINKQTLYVALQRNKYYLRHQSTLENVMTKKKYYPLGKTKDFVGEGANFILMRYLAITKFEGMFELSTMYINGDMCRNIYVSIQKGPVTTTTIAN